MALRVESAYYGYPTINIVKSSKNNNYIVNWDNEIEIIRPDIIFATRDKALDYVVDLLKDEGHLIDLYKVYDATTNKTRNALTRSGVIGLIDMLLS